MSKQLAELREAAEIVIQTWRKDGPMAIRTQNHAEAMNAVIRYLASTMSRGVAQEQPVAMTPVEVPTGKDAVLSI